MYYVYILQSELSFRLYIGQTNNLDDRYKRHNVGLVQSTRRERPWKLVYSERAASRSEAMTREKYLKSLKNSKYILENIVCKTGR